MLQRSRWWLAAFAPVVLISVLYGLATSEPSRSPAVTTVPASADVRPSSGALFAKAMVAVGVGEYLYARTVTDVVSYIVAVQQGEVVRYIAGRVAEEQAAAEAAAQQQAQQRYVPQESAAPPSGDCFGADVPDWIVQRESGGNPGVYNTEGSGSWGCYQFMPGTWAGAGCDQFGAFGSATADQQKQCANKVWAGGAGAGNWSE